MQAMSLRPFGFTIGNASDGSHLTAAAEIEPLGFHTLWITGGQLDRLDRLTDLLKATDQAIVGSAIIPPDVYGAAAVAEFYQRAESATPNRLLVGLGSPQRPWALAAVAMLFTPDYTATARSRLGPDRTLSVGLYVVLDDDAEAARATARDPLEFLTGLPGYVKSLRRQGFTDDDIATLSNQMVDLLVAWGSPDAVAEHAQRLRSAGADHVQFIVLGADRQPTGLSAARLLAPALR
jgi:alkanesulfonate monooxygenase SsuD/methylene tetrahydromethanopterin reductase-like flavin-dependent oxidoreductase (luciferase family)